MTDQNLRVRRDISNMKMGENGEWDEDILWYAYAVGAMMNDYDEDPRSWRWQANIHGSGSPDPERGLSPGVKPNPGWNQCPHGGWFFLPWHRVYLYYFEQIVGQVVKKLGGPDNWALPYWNYTRVAGDDPGSTASQKYRQLPLAFRQPKIPARIQPVGVETQYVDNPLYDSVKRSEPANAGYGIAWELVDPTDAMWTTEFPGVRPEYFGSKDTGDKAPHDEANFGQLESIPHNKIHLFVGGWMGVFVSPRDPIFWLHHANIDRLWPAWLAQGEGRKNPESENWLNKQHSFHDKDAKPASKTSKDVLTTEALGYKYDSLDVWTGPGVGVRSGVPLVSALSHSESQVVGHADAAELGSDPHIVPVESHNGAVDALTTAARSDTPQRAVLTISDVTADESPGTTFRVLLGAGGPQDDLGPDSPYFIGHLDFFGAIGGDINHHGGSGLSFSFDVTEHLSRLREQGLWDGNGVPPVVLTPVPLEPPAEDVAPLTVPVSGSRPRYGRVVLHTE